MTDPNGVLPFYASPNTLDTFAKLESYLDGTRGWYRKLNTVNSLRERVNADTQVFSGLLSITGFQPSTDPCATSGTTNFYSLYHKTGTVHPDAAKGTNTSITNGGSGLLEDHDSVEGEAYKVITCTGSNCSSLTQGSGGDGGGGGGGDCIPGGGVICNEDENPLPGETARQSWREIFLEEGF